MIKPTVGRIVWLYDTWKHKSFDTTNEFAAIITHVHSDALVNVAAFDPNGEWFANTSVYLVQDDGDPIPPGPYAKWMPYQKGQAAKTEAAEAKLKEAA